MNKKEQSAPIDNDLLIEDRRSAALGVPDRDRPASRPGRLSKAVCTLSALIGLQSNQRPVDGYQPTRRYPMKTYVGIDWSRDQHQVNIYNEQGARLYSQQISHSKKGFGQLHAQLQQLVHEASSCVIAIETQHNQLVDFLLGYGYCVYIIAPSLVKGNRSRQSNAGAKSDDKDAALLADILRTDQQRLIPWRPNSLLVRQMSVQIGVIDDLTTGIVRGHNRLQAHLLRYFPQGASVFSELTTQIALQLLLEYPAFGRARP